MLTFKNIAWGGSGAHHILRRNPISYFEKALFQQSDEEGEILFMSSINFLLFPFATWPVIREGISYQRTLTPLPTTSNNERDNFLFCQIFTPCDL